MKKQILEELNRAREIMGLELLSEKVGDIVPNPKTEEGIEDAMDVEVTEQDELEGGDEGVEDVEDEDVEDEDVEDVEDEDVEDDEEEDKEGKMSFGKHSFFN